jgi:phosphoenolpyruvate synthase/pyruvate phosphate dikinase
MQRKDFAELFEIMSGLPVTIRLLDPPLHEFLPHTEEEIAEVAKALYNWGADVAIDPVWRALHDPRFVGNAERQDG